MRAQSGMIGERRAVDPFGGQDAARRCGSQSTFGTRKPYRRLRRSRRVRRRRLPPCADPFRWRRTRRACRRRPSGRRRRVSADGSVRPGARPRRRLRGPRAKRRFDAGAQDLHRDGFSEPSRRADLGACAPARWRRRRRRRRTRRSSSIDGRRRVLSSTMRARLVAREGRQAVLQRRQVGARFRAPMRSGRVARNWPSLIVGGPERGRAPRQRRSPVRPLRVGFLPERRDAAGRALSGAAALRIRPAAARRAGQRHGAARVRPADLGDGVHGASQRPAGMHGGDAAG